MRKGEEMNMVVVGWGEMEWGDLLGELDGAMVVALRRGFKEVRNFIRRQLGVGVCVGMRDGGGAKG